MAVFTHKFMYCVPRKYNDMLLTNFHRSWFEDLLIAWGLHCAGQPRKNFISKTLSFNFSIQNLFRMTNFAKRPTCKRSIVFSTTANSRSHISLLSSFQSCFSFTVFQGEFKLGRLHRRTSLKILGNENLSFLL